jgi:hypothetical protein
MKTSKCFAMDGSKIEKKPIVECVPIDIINGSSKKFRIAKIAFIFTAEALALAKL